MPAPATSAISITSKKHLASHDFLPWLIPMFFAMFGFYVQSVCLHYATYSYVHKYALDSTHPPEKNEYATLADPIEEFLGKSEINIHILDSVAAVFPFAFFSLSVGLALWAPICQFRNRKSSYLRDMRANVLPLWTKVMLCAGFLFILKGIIGAVTTVPDSSGWEVCKARLKPEGVAWMKEDHTFLFMFFLDFWWNFTYHHPLRYCSDMMYSGHTFVVTLFALGLYELIRIIRPGHNAKKNEAAELKVMWMFGLAAFAVLEQVLEICLVEKTRFHYTSDIIVALVMTFLFYTNGVIAVVSKKWSKEGLATLADALKSVKQVTNCGRGGRPAPKLDEWDIEWEGADEKPDESEELTDSIIEQHPEWQHLESGGDIFIPPCCLPFCCCAGREHIYGDAQVKNIIKAFVLNTDTANGEQGGQTMQGKQEYARMKIAKPLQEYLASSMNFNEGVSMDTFNLAFNSCRSSLSGERAEDYGQLPSGP